MNDTKTILKRWINKADHDLGTAILTQKHNRYRIFKHLSIIAPKYRDFASLNI